MRRLATLAVLLIACEGPPPDELGATHRDDPGRDDGRGDHGGDDAGPVVDPGDGGASDPDTGDPPDPAGCESTEQVFVDHVWRGFMATTCAACHTADGLARDTRLVLVREDADDWVRRDLDALRAVARLDYEGESLLLVRPSNRHPDGHGGGEAITPGTNDYAALARLVRRLRGETDDCDQPIGDAPPDPLEPAGCDELRPGRRLLRRLSHDELRHTLRDLLGADVDTRAALTPDNVVHGFDNNGEALQVTALLADQYRTLAESVAEDVDLAPLLPCAGRDRDCAHRFIRDFGRRAFRRPLTDDETARYLEVYDLTAPDGFDAGVRWLLVAFLQSPNFLYRSELGRRLAEDDAHFTLTPYELASELSYLYWQTTPDDALLDLAATGDLLDPAVLAAQTERLAADPRSARTHRAFTERWLGLDQLAIVSRGGLTPELRATMAAEAATYIDGLWRDGATLGDLFGGILEQRAVLTTHALPTGSSPIHRGLLVRERLLCQDLPPPPANLDTSPPPVDPALSTRQRYAQHSSDGACRGCHELIDPIGFAFEHYDGLGRWRDTDGDHAIDARGEILRSPGTDATFDGLGELAAVLADSPDVERCYAEQWVRFGYGASEALPIDCYTESVAAETTALPDVLRALSDTPHFTARTGGAGELDVPGADLVPTEPGTNPEVPDPEPPPPPDEPDPIGDGPTPGARLELAEQSRWGTGYCADGVVFNDSDAAIDWVVEAEIEGTINNLWNAERSADSGRVRFNGVDWNRSVPPGGQQSFGFCADL